MQLAIRSFLPLSLFCGACLTAQAMEEPLVSEPVYELQDFVVVATRTPLGLDRVSPSVSYISVEEMEIWQDTHLTDVLEREAGLTLISSGAKGAQTSLFTRGTNSDHTSFFIDGRRMSSGFGNLYDLEHIQVSGLESVQVLKGAASVQYGSSNIGGVVDLRTATGLNSYGLEASVQGEFGSNDYYSGGFGLSYAEDNWGLQVDGSGLATENERENDEYEAIQQLHRVDVRLNKRLQFEWLSLFNQSDKQLPGDRFNPTLQDEQENTTWLLSPGLRFKVDSFELHAFYSRSGYKLQLEKPASNSEIKVDGDEFNLQADLEASDALLLSSGLLYRNDEAKNDSLGYRNHFEQFGLFGQALWQVTESLELRGGLRWDYFSEFDEKSTGSIEAIYSVSDSGLSLFAKLGSSYAPPSAADIAYDVDTTVTPLEPEESVSYEFGLRQVAFQESLTTSLVVFRNEIDELLDYDLGSFDTFNVEKAKTQGVEFQCDYALGQKTDLHFGYTHLHAVGSNGRLLRRPRHTVHMSIHHRPAQNLSFGIRSLGSFDRKDTDPVTFSGVQAKDYFVANLVADWEVTDQWSLYCRVENLFDKYYEPAAGYPALGRSGYLGARYRF
ncbi:MAG: TonB-dependent receptor plug domain-containing protein [Coraliomargaritaceae bacterium]